MCISLSKKLRAVGQCSCAFQDRVAFWTFCVLKKSTYWGNNHQLLNNNYDYSAISGCLTPKLVWRVDCAGAAR